MLGNLSGRSYESERSERTTHGDDLTPNLRAPSIISTSQALLTEAINKKDRSTQIEAERSPLEKEVEGLLEDVRQTNILYPLVSRVGGMVFQPLLLGFVYGCGAAFGSFAFGRLATYIGNRI